MKHTSVLSALLVGASVAVVTTAARPAAAITTSFSFQNIPGGDTFGDLLVDQFTLDIVDLSSNIVQFRFNNIIPSGSSQTARIDQVAFSVDPTISGLLSNIVLNVDNVGVVDFQSSTQNLSQSNLIAGWDGTTFGAVRVPGGGNTSPVNKSETLGINFTANANYSAVIAAITNRKLQTGIHVVSILPGGKSDSFVNSATSTPVPEPITMLGLGVGTLGLGALKRRYGNKKTKVTV
ncbi:hypothetical protein BCD64_07205 [Nostoc sp. MBR 210]|nr:hypothetical protein BCD64_07205 [Nostoc sp. MBR 210]